MDRYTLYTAQASSGESVTGVLYKRNGAFYIVTDDVDEFGQKMFYQVDPRTLQTV